MAQYADGQKVKFSGMAMPATIISGPYPTHGAERWLIRKADNTVSLVKERELSPVVTRRDAVAKTVYECTTGRAWETSTTYTRQGFYRLADKVLGALTDADDDAKKSDALAVGDRIRILRAGLESATVSRGDVLTVMSVNDTYLTTNAPYARFGSRWTFRLEGEGTGWERV